MTLKKTITGLVACLMLFSCVIPGIASATGPASFSDVQPTHWAYEAVEAISGGGLVNGFPDDTYAPSKAITMAELASIVSRIKGASPEDLKNNKGSYWAYGALNYCINDIKCMPDFGEITPANYNVPCTRELAVYVLVSCFNASTLSGIDVQSSIIIPDIDAVSPEYADAVIEAYNIGLVQGMTAEGVFAPKERFSRAEIATTLWRAGCTTAATPAKPLYLVRLPKMKEGNAICIPNAGINSNVTPEGFTQAAVDNYDIVYTEDAYGQDDKDTIGKLNPFVLGHYYGSLGILYNVEIGDYIYLRVNDVLEVYKVFVSESGHETGRRAIVGTKTGINIVDAYETKTLHLYTCYHSVGAKGRWIVLADLVDVIYDNNTENNRQEQ